MRIVLLLLIFGINGALEARPFEDQVLLPPPTQRGAKILRNKNVTFTNDQPEERGGYGVVKTLFAVKGRSQPHRSGKVLSQIKSGSVVTPFRESKDKKWIAVIVRSSGIRVWVPRSALPKLDQKLRLAKPDPELENKGSNDAIDDEL